MSDQAPNSPQAPHSPQAPSPQTPHSPHSPPSLPPGFDPSRELLLSPRSLRGLAHPVRVRMLNVLRDSGPATATGLASHLGINTGAASYHLRQLAAHGFVVEDVDRGTVRERWWRAAYRSVRYDPAAAGDDDRALGDAYLRAVGQQYAERILEAVEEIPTLPDRWRAAGTLSSARLRLRPDELIDLLDRISQLVESYRRDDGEATPAPPDTAPVVVQYQAFLQPGTDVGPEA
jgi:DNA-binding transcriptional ArsR family regulator